MTDEPSNDDERDRYETPVLRVLQTFKKEAMPAMTEEEGGWLLGQILDIVEQARAAETLVAERARPPAAAVDRLTEEKERRLEELAFGFHVGIEGEYGCPGVTCPGVQRLIVKLRELNGVGVAEWVKRAALAAPREDQ